MLSLAYRAKASKLRASVNTLLHSRNGKFVTKCSSADITGLVGV